MKKIAVIVGLGVLLTLSGCASMWKAMGVATVSSVQEQNDKVSAQLADLKTTVDGLSSKMSDVEKAAADVARIEALVNDLQGKIDLLPQETLKKLAEILTKAAAETQGAKP